ncbi:hypothetical protein [Petroclostridium sp. X23]|uniref:hypothetical protein n=1 Tax=Petroclostridium sp. X23 TaxID=3045146 RepID=UPI0024ADEA06|nr:hypothetical protein [Petroclostridium sp. X23]WHH57103.1 hypothetical protein QKW49_14775 [Petroclostridium sp. X23]
MSDDLNKKMEQFSELLSNEKMAENFKMLVSMLGNSQNNNSNGAAVESNTENQQPKPSVPLREMAPMNTSNPKIQMDDTMDTIIKIKKIVDKVNNADDPRVNLLLALKPYLNGKRKSHLDTAIKVVNLTKLSSVISEIDKK